MRSHPHHPCLSSHRWSVLTARDTWVFNSSGEKLRDLVEWQVAFYNGQVEALKSGTGTVERNPSQFKWDGAASGEREVVSLQKCVRRGFGQLSIVLSSASTTIWIGY